MMSQRLLRAINSKDSVSDCVSVVHNIHNCVVNEKSVATDEVYFASEDGVILDVDYRHMHLFRNSTLAGLIN